MTQKKSIKTIKAQLDQITNEGDLYFKELATDERLGVQKLVNQWYKKRAKEKALVQHFEEMKQFENRAKQKGYSFIAGIDEVGRGPLAGPVVAAAVILPADFHVFEVNDSKQLSSTKRSELYEKIRAQAIAIGIGVIGEKIIDQVNIYEATKLAMLQAIEKLAVAPDHLLIDAMKLTVDISQESIIKGDAKSISIACASIIAKVTRDRMMLEFDQQYPGYDFANNAGYGTKNHLLGLEKLGICPIHRKTFAPIKQLLK